MSEFIEHYDLMAHPEVLMSEFMSIFGALVREHPEQEIFWDGDDCKIWGRVRE